MRALEFIFEDLEGQKAKRGEFIKNSFENNWSGLPGYEDLDQFIEKVGEIDPSMKGIYMPWIARLAITKPNDNRTEDLDRLGQDLANFEKFKAQLEKKDINQYKSFSEIFTAIEPFLKPKKKAKPSKEELARADVVDVYSGPEGWIKIPTTKAAAQYLGRGTRWCTSASNSNMFDHYNKDDRLFVIFDKSTGERYQFHLSTAQFMDAADKPKGWENIPDWAKQPTVDWYKANNTDLNLKQLLRLQSWTKDDLVSQDSPHHGVLALMQQYGL